MFKKKLVNKSLSSKEEIELRKWAYQYCLRDRFCFDIPEDACREDYISNKVYRLYDWVKNGVRNL